MIEKTGLVRRPVAGWSIANAPSVRIREASPLSLSGLACFSLITVVDGVIAPQGSNAGLGVVERLSQSWRSKRCSLPSLLG
jgi:hypothetical protein